MQQHDELRPLMRRLWESACQDEPERDSVRVEDSHFVMVVATDQGADPGVLAMAAGVPADTEQIICDDSVTFRWRSYADEIFGVGGLLSQQMDNYEVRLPQLHMARLVQRSIEMREPAVVEAGTGTGKSLAYAAIALAMDKSMVISTSNKNLQMQLYGKDLPFLLRLFPGRTVALAVGKSNYACRHKAEDQMSGLFRIEDSQLRDWYMSTESGNTEEIDFAVDWKQLADIRVDDDCAGKFCPMYGTCFYYRAREGRESADVIITNHALLCLNQLYPAAAILPEVDLVVVDEAHKLPDFARNALGVEFTMRSVDRVLDRAQEYDADTSMAEVASARFYTACQTIVLGADDRQSQIGIQGEQELPTAESLAEELREVADELWEADDFPNTPQERKVAKTAQAVRSKVDQVDAMAHSSTEQYVRWLEMDRNDPDMLKLCRQPHDVSSFIAQIAGNSVDVIYAGSDHTHCTRCHRKLTATTVHILNGEPYGPDCILHADPFGDAELVSLEEWLTEEHEPFTPRIEHSRATLFTSATIAAPDMKMFMRTCGLPDALQMQAASPFDYESNGLLYVPNGSSPAPNDNSWRDWAVDEMQSLVLASRGGAFLLFTSYSMMQYAAERLRSTFEEHGWPVLVQGELPKLETARRFGEDGSAVLFATKSFFEGVSIEGTALRMVVVDKMPFEAPSPLNAAMEAALQRYAKDELGLPARRAEWYPFEALRVPRMVLELKQATGRLIRTQRDYGVMAVLDSRLRSATYGRRMALPALPPAPLVSRLTIVDGFFADKRNPADEEPEPLPEDPVELMKALVMPV